MSLEEARLWIRKFDQWFVWNAKILCKKRLVAQRVLLENFLDNRMLSKVQSDETVTNSRPVKGPDGLLKKLESYYTDDLPMIIHRCNFISCKQDDITRPFQCNIMTEHAYNLIDHTKACMPSLLCRSQILIGCSSDSILRTVVHTVRELQL